MILKGSARLGDLHIWQMEKVKNHKEGQPVLWLLDGLPGGKEEKREMPI